MNRSFSETPRDRYKYFKGIRNKTVCILTFYTMVLMFLGATSSSCSDVTTIWNITADTGTPTSISVGNNSNNIPRVVRISVRSPLHAHASRTITVIHDSPPEATISRIWNDVIRYTSISQYNCQGRLLKWFPSIANYKNELATMLVNSYQLPREDLAWCLQAFLCAHVLGLKPFSYTVFCQQRHFWSFNAM